MMELDPGELGAVANRLRRAQGQIGGILQMIEQGRDCKDIVTQLAAANHALDRAGFALIANSLNTALPSLAAPTPRTLSPWRSSSSLWPEPREADSPRLVSGTHPPPPKLHSHPRSEERRVGK